MLQNIGMQQSEFRVNVRWYNHEGCQNYYNKLDITVIDYGSHRMVSKGLQKKTYTSGYNPLLNTYACRISFKILKYRLCRIIEKCFELYYFFFVKSFQHFNFVDFQRTYFSRHNNYMPFFLTPKHEISEREKSFSTVRSHNYFRNLRRQNVSLIPCFFFLVTPIKSLFQTRQFIRYVALKNF